MRKPMPLAAVLVMLLAMSVPAKAQVAENARVLMQTGRVSVEHTGELWVLAQGQTITPGQVVVTGPDGYAQLELSDHSIIEVFANSRLVFHPNRANWRDLVDVYLGKIRLQIQHLTDGETPYHVTSPTAVISIRGTVLDVQVDSPQSTTIQVETGVIGVRHRLFPGKEVTVETGQTLTVTATVPLTAAKGTSPFVTAGRIARIAGETLARMGGPGAIKGNGGGHSGSSGNSGSSGSGASTARGGGSASTASSGSSGSVGAQGTNQPAPAPSDKNNGSNAPPGDVIP